MTSDDFPGPLYRLCTDEACPVAWGYRDPPAEHYHYIGGDQVSLDDDDPRGVVSAPTVPPDGR